MAKSKTKNVIPVENERLEPENDLSKTGRSPMYLGPERNVTRLIALDIQTPASMVFGCLGLHYQLKQCNLKGSSFNITTITIGVASSFNSPQFVTTKLDPT